MGRLGKSILSGNITQILLIFCIQGVGALLGFFLQVLMARLLSVEDFGKLNIYLNLSVIISMIISFGSTESVLRYISIVSSDAEKCAEALKKAIVFCIANWVVVFIFFILMADVCFDYLINEWSWYILFGISLLSLSQALLAILQNFDRALGHPLRAMIPNFILKSLIVGAGVYVCNFFINKLDVEIAVSIYLLAFALLLVVFIIYERRYLLYANVQLLSFQYKVHIKNNYQYFINSISQTLMKNMDLIFIGMFLNGYEAGVYAVAARINIVIVFGLASLNILYGPIVARLFKENKIFELNNSLKEANKIVFLFSLTFFILIVLAGPWILSLFGSEFASGFTILILLGVVNLIEALFGITGSVLNMTGSQHVFNKILYLVLFLYIVLSPPSIIFWGTQGLASMVVVITFLKNFLQWKYIYFTLKIRSGVFSDFYLFIRRV